MSTHVCPTCSGTYSDPQPDGSPYEHVCPEGRMVPNPRYNEAKARPAELRNPDFDPADPGDPTRPRFIPNPDYDPKVDAPSIFEPFERRRDERGRAPEVLAERGPP